MKHINIKFKSSDYPYFEYVKVKKIYISNGLNRINLNDFNDFKNTFFLHIIGEDMDNNFINIQFNALFYLKIGKFLIRDEIHKNINIDEESMFIECWNYYFNKGIFLNQ